MFSADYPKLLSLSLAWERTVFAPERKNGDKMGNSPARCEPHP
jgi:hypothetical protein